MNMRNLVPACVALVVFALAAWAAQTQNAKTQNATSQNAAQGAQTQAPSTADPYANNAAPGATQFPLAAPAGKDSNAKGVAPAGAVNQGAFDPATWKYGTAFNAPEGSKVWNPVRLKMMQGGKVTGGTLFTSTDP